MNPTHREANVEAVEGILIFLALIAMAVLLPVLLPLVAALDAFYRHRKWRDAERFACLRCGRVLGREGLAWGDAAWAEHLSALQRAHPYAKLRVVRDVYAVCPRCGARYDHDEKERTFRLLSDPPPAAPRFTADEIRALTQARPVRGPLPFDPEDEQSIRAFYGALTMRLEQAGGLRSRVEWGHYGSGYASFVEAWFYPADGGARLPSAPSEEHHMGLVVLFSRLSRFFVLGQDEKSWAHDGRSGSGGLPCFEAVDAIDHPAIRALAGPVTTLLQEAGLERLRQADLTTLLPDAVQVPTILTGGPYREFDALFHWED